MVSRPEVVVADLHRFNDEQDPDPDPHQSDKNVSVSVSATLLSTLSPV
jgi:hypothetical protein